MAEYSPITVEMKQTSIPNLLNGRRVQHSQLPSKWWADLLKDGVVSGADQWSPGLAVWSSNRSSN